MTTNSHSLPFSMQYDAAATTEGIDLGLYKRGRIYWLNFTGWDKRRRQVSLGTPDKDLASILARHLVNQHALARLGMIDPAQLEANQRGKVRPIDLLSSFLADEFQSVWARSDAASIIERFIDSAKVSAAADFGRAGIKAQLRDFLDCISDSGVQRRRVVDHLRAIKRFAAWMLEHDYIASNEVAKVGLRRIKGDDAPKVLHEAMLPPDAARLIAGRNGLYYAFRIWTGFRAETAAKLLCGDLVIPGKADHRAIAHIIIRPEIVKNRLHGVLIPIPPCLVEQLRGSIELRHDACPLFDAYPQTRWKRETVLRDDLRAAGIEGDRINHRSFRPTQQTWFRAAGVDDNTIGTLRLDKGEGTAALRRHNYSDYRQLLPLLREAMLRAERWRAEQLEMKAVQA